MLTDLRGNPSMKSDATLSHLEVDHIPIGAAITTYSGKMIDANQTLLDILGYASKKNY
jgi:hypothetical protein